MSTPNTVLEHDRPAPPGARRRLVWLGIAIAAPPLLWNLQLLVLSAFAVYACYPAERPLGYPAHGMAFVPALEYAGDAAAILLTIVAGLVSLGYLRMAREQTAGSRNPAILWHFDSVCFMAYGGLLSSGGFLAAIVFEAIASIVVHPCV
jgi:hypothetical protein